MKLPVVTRFAILSFLCVVALALVMGLALSSLLTRAVSEWEWENTAALARREVEVAGLDAFFTAPQGPEARERWGKELSRRFTGLPEVVRVKVWDRQATVLWSDQAQLIGKRFPDNQELRAALAGKVAVEIKNLTKPEHAYEREAFPVLAEVYVPLFSKKSGEVLGVLEVYKIPARLFATVRWGRTVIWTISLAGGLALYLVLLPLVRQVYGREVQEETLRAYAGRLEQEVTERTRELQAALKVVEESQQRVVQGERLSAFGQLASGVAHDFNNLLAVILGRAQLLLRQQEIDPTLARQLRVIEQAALDGGQTIRRIQEFTRTRSPRRHVQVDLPQILRDAREFTRPRWENEALASGIAYDIRIEGGPVPLIAGDPAELREAFTNLLLNALEAMPQGGQVRLTAARDGGQVRVTVQDTGRGMSEEVREKAFEPFFTTKGPQGNGLGLSVVWGVVQRHDGEITLDSEEGKGTTFTLDFPIRAEAVKPEAPAARPAPPRGAKILIIDDEPEVRAVLRDFLEAQGHTAVEAADGPAGVARFEAERFDLVLTDLSMPGMSGWEVAATLKSRVQLPVGLITGWSDQLDPAKLAAKQVDFVLTKPFQLDEVLRCVAEALAFGGEPPALP
ncbi:MAG: response regulator [Deltaproteobacteria bacterium]|nr:response regulator [Deltaproteobacteria bacterium]